MGKGKHPNRGFSEKWSFRHEAVQGLIRQNSTGVLFEVVKRKLGILANLDQIAVWIAHVATPFPAVVVERLSEKDRAFVAPLFVTGPNVRDT
jgi:hypothetical protein